MFRRNQRTMMYFGLMAAVLNAVAFAQTEVANNARKDELQKKGLAQALANNFSAAAETYRELVRIDPNDVRGREALESVQSAMALSADRDAMRKKSYDAHLDRAQKLIEKKKWSEALREVRIAREYALDPADIRKLPWLGDVVSHVKEKIADYRAKGSWVDALILYDELAGIYEDTPDGEAYTAESKFCAQRAHFMVAYKKDGDWKRRILTDVQVEIVPEVLRRVAQEYVRSPDFKEMTLSGLKYLLLLAQMKEKELAEVFPQLQDEDRVTDFVTRIEAERDRVAASKEVSWREAVSHFERALRINKSSLKFPEEVITHEFLDGALMPLDDFTSMIWPSEVSEFNKHTKGSFAGVGISITEDRGPGGTGFIRVETPLEDSPAFEAGVSPGDLIVAVDGKSTKDMDINDAVRIITGKSGTPVTLTMRRPPAEGTTDLVLRRREIKLTSVKGYMRLPDHESAWEYLVDPKFKIGYIRVNQFTETTAKELEAALKQLKKEGGRGLILDLRFNPGGLLTAAIDVCELFLDEHQGIVETRGRTQQPTRRKAHNDEPLLNVPMIVLVNEQSASASEIVAGALSGNSKACIVGERTFGKGSVQNLYPIADNKAQFKLTTAKYYVTTDPNGENWRCVHKEPKAKVWGVDPNVMVRLFPSETRRVFELRRKQDLIRGRNQKELPKNLFDRKRTAATQPSTQPADDLPPYVEDEAPDRDPQLETALSVMRMRLVSPQDWVLRPATASVTSSSDSRS